jgi:hypothetical protein
VTTLSKDDYLKASRGLATGFGATVDFADPQVGATVQSKNGIASPHELPGQVFSVDQLPNPALAVAYGLPPVTIPERLIVEGDDAEKHPQGKDVLDILSATLREELDSPILTFDGNIASSDDAMKSFDERTGANAGNTADGKDKDKGDQQEADAGEHGQAAQATGAQHGEQAANAAEAENTRKSSAKQGSKS